MILSQNRLRFWSCDQYLPPSRSNFSFELPLNYVTCYYQYSLLYLTHFMYTRNIWRQLWTLTLHPQLFALCSLFVKWFWQGIEIWLQHVWFTLFVNIHKCGLPLGTSHTFPLFFSFILVFFFSECCFCQLIILKDLYFFSSNGCDLLVLWFFSFVSFLYVMSWLLSKLCPRKLCKYWYLMDRWWSFVQY